jgi:dTDP-4-amino-4,6-dideoxygalactose transaminase
VTDVELPGTDEVARTSLALPISPILTSAQASHVTTAVRAALVDG